METIAVPPQPIPFRRIVTGIDPGQFTGIADVVLEGPSVVDVVARTLDGLSPSGLVDQLINWFDDTVACNVDAPPLVYEVAVEGWTWYGASSERARGLPPAAFASGFVSGVVEAYSRLRRKLDATYNLTRPMILQSLGLPSNSSKPLARERVRLLIPSTIRKALDGASEHAYDAVAVALAADAVRGNPLTHAKPATRRPRR